MKSTDHSSQDRPAEVPSEDPLDTDLAAEAQQFLLDHIPRDLLFRVLDNPYDSTLIIDAGGRIRFMSRSYEAMYDIRRREVVGRHILDVIPRTGLMRPLQTGKPEIEAMRLKGRNRVIARIPLKKNGEIIGVVAKVMFWNPAKLKQLHERIATLENHLDYYREELGLVSGSRYGMENIIGRSSRIREAKAIAGQAAGSASPLIIAGESGTGKELFAHAIHQQSTRRRHNFVRVNCASIPSDLIESELFGYESGAFTGARPKGRMGKFEFAHRGTIFLDEIGDMPLRVQVKLMRVLQEKEVERLGGSQPRQIDFRLICATHRNLEKQVRAGRFRLDLYYRINVMVVHLPPLREIREDIPLLIQHYLRQLGPGGRTAIRSVSREAMAVLQKYHWPGNVRELRNLVERAMIICQGPEIGLEDLPPTMGADHLRPRDSAAGRPARLREVLARAEKQTIQEALRRTGNNRAQTARILGIHRTGLYQKLKKYGLS